ncbi:porin [Shimia sp. SDUM112013]|uniref:porin n=1 Tax=Shimia sp. SDUM112013 TaxID=3136160 RepID=UPI0032EFD70A
MRTGWIRVGALTAGMAATALWADPDRDAGDTVSPNIRLYGHFTPSILSIDDGVDTYTNLVDSAHSGGRIGLWWDNAFGEPRLQFNAEFSLGLRSSSAISQGAVPPLIDFGTYSVRKFELVYTAGNWGRVSVGQGSMGSDGVTESDLSGTGLATHVGITDTAGGYLFRTAAGTISTLRIKDVFPTFDGGRTRRLRYDSPDLNLSYFGQLRFAASVGVEDIGRIETLNDALSDVGVFYSNRLGTFDIAGSAGLSLAETATGREPQIAGSFSVLHAPTGLNVTAASGSRNNGGSYGYTKIGIRRDWFDVGETRLSLDLYEGIDTFGAGTRTRSVGLGLVQDLEAQNVEVFLGLREFSADGTGAVRYRDMRSVMFGLRWKFRKLQNRRSVFEGMWQG